MLTDSMAIPSESGSDISVKFEGDTNLSIQINKNKLADILKLDDVQILNSGIIQAHGGNVVLTTTQASQIQASIIKRDECRVFSFTNGTVIEKDGNGGTVIVWSDGRTHAYGNLSAKGGIDKGNGGFIETSSKNYVDLQTRIDVSAGNGLHGEWLIDPSSLTIENLLAWMS